MSRSNSPPMSSLTTPAMPATVHVNRNPSNIAHSSSQPTSAQANACQHNPAPNACHTHHSPTSLRPAQHPDQASTEPPQAPPQQAHAMD
eukprot:scaffold236521_cov18-Prasinocladus_malaysianus.AAC.1